MGTSSHTARPSSCEMSIDSSIITEILLTRNLPRPKPTCNKQLCHIKGKRQRDSQSGCPGIRSIPRPVRIVERYTAERIYEAWALTATACGDSWAELDWQGHRSCVLSVGSAEREVFWFENIASGHSGAAQPHLYQTGLRTRHIHTSGSG
jgi:hypothetical protein